MIRMKDQLKKYLVSLISVMVMMGSIADVAAADESCRGYVALTFDDGPGRFTNELLDILDRYDVPATFYLVGMHVEEYAAVVQRMAYNGHEIGNHSWSHAQLPLLSDTAVREQILWTNDVIERVAGVRPQTMRPPYGAVNKRIRALANMPVVLWTRDSLDWRNGHYQSIVGNALYGIDNQSIILLHDIHELTIQAVPGLIDEIRSRGFCFSTVSQQPYQKVSDE